MSVAACTLANTPNGLADLMIQRRIEGKSWGEIAEEFGMPNPGAARKAFTKLTGITDYKIKGKELKDLVDKGLVDQLKQSVPKAAKKAVKSVDDAVQVAKALDTELPKPLDPVPIDLTQVKELISKSNLAPSIQHMILDNVYNSIDSVGTDFWKYKEQLKFWANDIDMTEDDVEKLYKAMKAIKTEHEGVSIEALFKGGKEAFTSVVDGAKAQAVATAKANLDGIVDDVLTKHIQKAGDLQTVIVDKLGNVKSTDILTDYTNGTTSYLKLTQKYGVSFGDVDQLIWTDKVNELEDIWKAYVSKPTSETGFNAVKELVFDLRGKGFAVDEVADLTGIDKKVVDLIVKDKWKLPSPGSTKYVDSAPLPSVGGYSQSAHVSPQVFYESPINAGGNYLNESEWIKWAEQTADLTPSELEAFKRYTGSAYYDLNNWLRDGQKYPNESWRAMTEAMDRGFRPIPKEASVTRFVDTNAFPGPIEKLGGTVYSDDGFMSTAIHPGGTFSSKPVKMVIDVPKGYLARYVDTFSNHKGEKELLLPRGTKMMVTRVEKTDSHWILHMKVIP